MKHKVTVTYLLFIVAMFISSCGYNKSVESTEDIVWELQPVDESISINNVTITKEDKRHKVLRNIISRIIYRAEHGYNFEKKVVYNGDVDYPTLTPCRFFTNIEMTDANDAYEQFKSIDSYSECEVVLTLINGIDTYNAIKDPIQNGAKNTGSYYMFTTNTSVGETHVIYTYDDTHKWYHYCFNIGDFTVDVWWINEESLTEEDLQVIIDNIVLD